MHHGSWRLISLVKVLVKDGSCTKRGILSMVIPYTILWNGSSFHSSIRIYPIRLVQKRLMIGG